MKKLFSMLVTAMLVALGVACSAEAGNAINCPPKTGVEVVAVFAAADIQPYTEASGETEKLDLIWIYYKLKHGK